MKGEKQKDILDFLKNPSKKIAPKEKEPVKEEKKLQRNITEFMKKRMQGQSIPAPPKKKTKDYFQIWKPENPENVNLNK